MNRSLRREKEAYRVIAIERARRKANEELLPQLHEAIEKFRPLLESFRKNDFAGLSNSRKLSIRAALRYPTSCWHNGSQYSYIPLKGKWLQPFGFWPGHKVHVLAVNEMIILYPDHIPEAMPEPDFAPKLNIYQETKEANDRFYNKIILESVQSAFAGE